MPSLIAMPWLAIAAIGARYLSRLRRAYGLRLATPISATVERMQEWPSVGCAPQMRLASRQCQSPVALAGRRIVCRDVYFSSIRISSIRAGSTIPRTSFGATPMADCD